MKLTKLEFKILQKISDYCSKTYNCRKDCKYYDHKLDCCCFTGHHYPAEWPISLGNKESEVKK